MLLGILVEDVDDRDDREVSAKNTFAEFILNLSHFLDDFFTNES